MLCVIIIFFLSSCICWHVFRNSPVFANTCPGFENKGSFANTFIWIFSEARTLKNNSAELL